jgi:hypothetical protein
LPPPCGTSATLSTLTPTNDQSSDDASLTTSGMRPDCIVALPELLASVDVSEPPPPQAASVAAIKPVIAVHVAYLRIVLGIVRFMSWSPLHVP